MITVISPAKNLDYETPVAFDKHSNPDYDTCYKAKLVNKRNQSFPFAPYLRLEDLERL